PYFVFVWDLEHRVQPYFPEVSASGAWDFRENHFQATLRRASIIATGTEVGRQQIEQFYQVPSNRIVKIPHGTPSDALAYKRSGTTAVLERYGLDQSYLLYPAQFWPHKNHFGL